MAGREVPPVLLEICGEAVRRGVTDIHLQSGLPAVFFVEGQLQPAAYGPLTADQCDELVLALLSAEARQRLESSGQAACLYAPPQGGRFRVHAYRQRDALAARLRVIRPVPPLHSLGLPPVLEQLAQRPAGLVVVGGLRGSGVTTTLAAMVDWIHRNLCRHILCIEDPPEYEHPPGKSLISQGRWSDLRHSNADVVVISDLDKERSLRRALRLASQGVLVLAGLNAKDVHSALQRLVSYAPNHELDEIYDRLAEVFEGIVVQQLVPATTGRVAATEVLLATPTIKNLIRENKRIQLYNAIQTGNKLGMHLMEQALFELIQAGKITPQVALDHCHYPEDLQRMLDHRR